MFQKFPKETIVRQELLAWLQKRQFFVLELAAKHLSSG